jgi:purine-binding chemotaxis protein CheW
MSNKDTEKQQIIVFKLDDKLYGVNIGQIREITRIGEIAPMPNSPGYINGVTNLRGQVTTVVDLRKRLGLPTKNFDKESRMMVIESQGKSVGMIVDSVAEVTMLPRADIEETPEIARATDDKSSYLKGIGKKDDKLIILVDLHELQDWKSLPTGESKKEAIDQEATDVPSKKKK